MMFFGIAGMLAAVISLLAALGLLASPGPVTQIIGAIMLVVCVLSLLLAVVVSAAQRILRALDQLKAVPTKRGD